MADLLKTKFQVNVYIPSYLEELSLLPLGRELEPSEQFSARFKAQQIINMWEESASSFSSLLLSYLEEETDLASLTSLEERLGFITRQLEQETRTLKSPPLLFAPSSEPLSREEGEAVEKEAS
jgi:hypothetical protein